ncbi:hypothetical protein SELR_14450 [Selenomonas ruminantium subsp. lactilytica TAM6421]|uniref:Uncharacterized protein n=1 Tax=Selenomonas ruminantium subsp. lactilytica (strain NBRC 103574 / TAM6421) TaxID=927704 RepID=I0GQW6_SELRL|nr:hypothetical protein SELR_14450 [Selenomonas ruminantium subsp. lactilytica TAM6421]
MICMCIQMPLSEIDEEARMDLLDRANGDWKARLGKMLVSILSLRS